MICWLVVDGHMTGRSWGLPVCRCGAPALCHRVFKLVRATLALARILPLANLGNALAMMTATIVP